MCPQNNSNTIEVKELRNILEKITRSLAVVDAIMSGYDSNQDQRIDRVEFARLATEHPEIVTSALRSLWSRFDIQTPRGERSDPLSTFTFTPTSAVATAGDTPQTSGPGAGSANGVGPDAQVVPFLTGGGSTPAVLLPGTPASPSPPASARSPNGGDARSAFQPSPLTGTGTIVYRSPK